MSDVKHNFFQRADGRYVLAYAPEGDWKRPKQVTAPKTIRSKKEADGWLKQRLAELRAGGGQLPEKSRGSKTLRDVHERLMEVRADHPDVKPSTLKNNWTHLRAQLLDTEANTDPKASIADVPMADVDVTRARALVRAVRARCSPNHTRNIFSTARMLWDVAIGEKIISTANPFRNQLVINELPRQQSLHEVDGEIDPITVPLAAVQALLNCEDIAEERRIRYAWAATTGADDGELAGLTFRRVHEDGFVQIREALAIRGKSGFATLSTPKTPNRLRDIPLHPAALAALADWREAWERLACRKPKDGDFIFAKFTQKHGAEAWRPLSAKFLRVDLRTVNATLVRAGAEPVISDEKIAQLDFKAFRRTFSSALRAKGVDEETRGQLMGHSGSTVTARNYTAHELAVLAEQVARIPLTWPSVRGSVRTTPVRCTTPAPMAPNVLELCRNLEARIGFEPTYDGFAKQNALCAAAPGSCDHAENPAVDAHVSIGTGEYDDVETGPSGRGRTIARPLAKVASGAQSVRVEVDGKVVAQTDVVTGEPVADVEERLRLAVRQRGGLR